MKILCKDGRFTKGYGVAQGKCWVSLLQNELKCTLVNKGVNGDTTGGMLARFSRDVVDEKAQYVLIEGGFNDFMAGADCGAVQANVMSLVHQAYHNNIVPILLIVPEGNQEQFKENWPAFIGFIKVQEKYREYKTWIEEFSEGFSVFHIDCSKAGRLTKEPHSFYLDGIHMNAQGHKIASEIVSDYISTVIL